MFGFIFNMFIGLLSVCAISFSESLVSNSKGPTNCASLNNHPCTAGPTVVNIKYEETLFYPFTVSFDKSGGSCNTIYDPYTRVCVPNKVKNMNVKVFNLMSGVDETKFSVQHESCEYKCVLNGSLCNTNQK